MIAVGLFVEFTVRSGIMIPGSGCVAVVLMPAGLAPHSKAWVLERTNYALRSSVAQFLDFSCALNFQMAFRICFRHALHIPGSQVVIGGLALLILPFIIGAIALQFYR